MAEKVNIAEWSAHRWIILRASDPAQAWSGDVHWVALGDAFMCSWHSLAHVVIYADQQGFDIQKIGGFNVA